MCENTMSPTTTITKPTTANSRPFSRPFDSLIFSSPTRPQTSAGPAAMHKTPAAVTLKIEAPAPTAVKIPQIALTSVQMLHRGVGVSLAWGAGARGAKSGDDGSTGARDVVLLGCTGKDTDGSFWYRVAPRRQAINRWTPGPIEAQAYPNVLCTPMLQGASVWERVQRREEEDEIEDVERDKQEYQANRNEAGDDA